MKIRMSVLAFILTVTLGFCFSCTSCSTVQIKPVAQAAPISHTDFSYQHPATKSLEMLTGVPADDGSCSGTMIHPNVLLGAKHCFVDEKTQLENVKTLLIDDKEIHIVGHVIFDDADHALVVTDTSFPSYVTVGAKPVVGGNIHYWGNPDGVTDIFRKGYITTLSHHMMLFDVNGFFGDSGSGIFDDNGNVVGVISDISSRTEVYKSKTKGRPPSFYNIKFMGALDFAFTEQQLIAAGIDPKDPAYQALLGPSRLSVEPKGEESF